MNNRMRPFYSVGDGRGNTSLRLKVCCAAAVLLCAASVGYTQSDAGVSGLVMSATTREPISNADVQIVGTGIHAVTGADGRYTILHAPIGVFRIEAHSAAFGSGASDNVNLIQGQPRVVNLVLSRSALLRNEAVTSATAFPLSERLAPFAVGTLSKDELPVAGLTSAIDVLQGKVAGAAVAHANAIPGAQPSVQLRTPISLTDSTAPLYVVDGVVLSPLFRLTTQDIESLDIARIEVLKGVSASALYGARGTSGVVSITTNRGSALPLGATQFSVRNEAGRDYANDWFQSPRAHAYRVNAAGQYVNAVGAVVTRDKRILQANGIAENPYIDPTFDHGDQVFQVAAVNTQTLAVQHNSVATNYSLSYSRNQQPGVVRDVDGYVRQSVRFNIDHRWNDRLQVGFSGAHADATSNPATISFTDVARLGADVDLLKPNGTSRYQFTLDSIDFALRNPLAVQLLNENHTKRKRTLFNLNAAYHVTPWLTLNALGSYDRGYQNETIASSSFPLPTLPRLDMARENHDSTAQGQFVGGATATKVFGDLTGRVSLHEEVRRESSQSSTYVGSFSLDAGIGGQSDTVSYYTAFAANPVERHVKATSIGSDVNFANRYVLDLLLRREATSAMSSSYAWTNAMRASALWAVNNEKWFPFQSLTAFNLHYSVGWVQAPGISFARMTYTNIFGPNETHRSPSDSVVEQESGIEIALLNRMSASFTYALSRSSATRLSSDLPPLSGDGPTYRTSLKGHTSELTFKARLLDRLGGVQWDVALTGSRGGSSISHWTQPCALLTYREYCTGADLEAISGAHLVRNKNDLPAGAAATAFDINDEGYAVAVGAGNTWRDGKSKNLWGTTVATGGRSYAWGLPLLAGDSTSQIAFGVIGDGNPTLRFGVQNTIQYRGLRLYGQLSGQLGGQVYDQTKQQLYASGSAVEIDQSMKADELRKPVSYYRALANTGYLQNFVESATNARLSEASIGYQFNAKTFGLLRHVRAQHLEIDLVGRNLFTIGHYRGPNPQGASVNAPIDVIGYPLTRTFSLATSIVF